MQPIRVSEEQFDLQGFVGALERFWAGQSGAERAKEMFILVDDSDPDYDQRGSEVAPPLTRLRAGRQLFVSFHNHAHLEGRPLACADGTEVPAREDEDAPRELPGEDMSYGYLVELRGGTVTVQPGELCDHLPGVSPAEDCGELGEKMERFARQFSRGR